MPDDASEPYLIWSHKHRAWWAPNSAGYTPHVTEAGHYTQQDAIAICADSMPGAFALGALPSLPVRVDDLDMIIAIYRAFYGSAGPPEPWE